MATPLSIAQIGSQMPGLQTTIQCQSPLKFPGRRVNKAARKCHNRAKNSLSSHAFKNYYFYYQKLLFTGFFCDMFSVILALKLAEWKSKSGFQ